MSNSEEIQQVLDFERTWWRNHGSKPDAIRQAFNQSEEEYHQRLDALLELPAAMEADPFTVRRVKRARAGQKAKAGS